MSGASETPLDLVGGPWAVIESDPGVFTTLLRELGAQKLQLVELYDIEPWAVDHLHPHGLIFCFLWQGDAHRPSDFRDPAADQVWFANQLVDDGCASYAFLNVLMNCPDVYIGQNLTEFRADTEQMSPVMKGLAVSNNEQLRHAHNSLARPADLRSSLYFVARATLSAQRKKATAENSAAQKRKATPRKRNAKAPNDTTPANGKKGSKGKEKAEESTAVEEDETYHFIGYVPAHGKVWELDGLKTGPLEVGEYTSHKAWMDTARPALRMKMERYGGSGANIRFSLLALVDSAYEIASDEYELIKKAKGTIERVLGERWPAWREKVDPEVIALEASLFGTANALASSSSTPAFASDFGARRIARDREIMLMQSQEQLLHEWTCCVREAGPKKVAVEDEVNRARIEHTEHLCRTHDYEPFITGFITALHNADVLHNVLESTGVKSRRTNNDKKTASGSGRKSKTFATSATGISKTVNGIHTPATSELEDDGGQDDIKDENYKEPTRPSKRCRK